MSTPAPPTPPSPPPSLTDLMGRFEKEPWYWQLLILLTIGPLMAGLMGPAKQELQNIGFQAIPDVPMSPADLATAIVRGFVADDQDTQNQAAQSGINPARFATLVQLAGAALAPQMAAEAMRRGIIPHDSGDPNKPGFVQAIHQGDLRDMWTDVVAALAYALPSAVSALDALLEGQVDEKTARALYTAWGGAASQDVPGLGTTDVFQVMFNTRGASPTPSEAAVMANRGIIPWGFAMQWPPQTVAELLSAATPELPAPDPTATTFAQAFLEGPWRNKWMGAMARLAAYFPPPRTLVTQIRDGALTDAEALALLEAQGLPQDLAESYVVEGHSAKLAGTKQVAQSTVETLYRDKIISSQQATQLLNSLGYSDSDAAWILEIVDLQREQASLSSAVTKIRTLYVDHKLTRAATIATLASLQIPGGQVSDLMTIWDLEAAANVKTLTESQIADAWEYQVMTQAQAQAALETLGYQPHDAWVVLSVKNKAPLGNEPPATAITPTPGPQGG